MTDKEIMLMCKRLSYKYPQVSIRADLTSEAILAVCEMLDKELEVHPAKLYNAARLAMFDYVNLKTKVLNVPVNDTTRAIAAGRDVPKHSNYSQAGIDAIRNALQPSVEFDDEYLAPVEDHADGYEDKEYIERGLGLLTERERDVIEGRYYDNKTQEELAVLHGISQSTLDRWEKVALKKMRFSINPHNEN